MDSFKRNISGPQRIEYGFYQFLDHFIGRSRVTRILGKRRRKFYANLLESLKKSGAGKVIPIERRTDLSREEFRKKYLNKGIPVVLEGAAKDWDCVKKWSLEYFKELHGEDEIVLYAQKNDTHLKHDGYEVVKLADVIDNIRSGGKKYYRHYPLLRRHPEHIRDFDNKWLSERRNKHPWIKSFEVYIGGKDSPTHMHSENLGNLFVQVYGEKKWSLYPPYYNMIMDPNPVRNIYRNPQYKSPLNLFNPFEPDYDLYPEYQYIDRYETTIKPGDILWNPPYYWHEVVNVTDSIGIGYKWFSLSLNVGISPFYALLDLFAKNPPIWKSLKLLEKDFNLLVIAEKGKLDNYIKEKAEKEKAEKEQKQNVKTSPA